MMKTVSDELFAYVTRIFRQLHMYPEIGFDLYKTSALVASELDALGISHTDKYAKCSLVGQIGNREDLPTLAIRADMDALPVHETVDVPYKSRIDGVMHACGHDSHTAILLAVAKVLKSMEVELPCNVRLLFQPSEECAVSGAKAMLDNGCLEGVDSVICLHCDGAVESGELAVQVGPCMAACVPLRIQFHGLTSHATIPEKGIDAIAMAVESYGRLKDMVKEEAAGQPYIWSIGVFKGGEVHNVIADFCTQDISFRFYDEEFAERVHKKTERIINEIAARYGGKAELHWHMSCPPVNNDISLAKQMCAVAEDLGVKMTIMQPKKSSEDFSWFAAQKPGMLFRYGIHNDTNGCVAAAHRPDFKVDEEAMKTAILAFVNFVMQYHGQ
jgi:amidohydrolase